MTKRYVIVTTYPASGSRNIGDWLITESLKEIVFSFEPAARIDIVWRADDWHNVKTTLESADHVFFACLAIRPRMHQNEYPYLSKFLETGVPFSVHAAGTDLPVSRSRDLFARFSNETIHLLKQMDTSSIVFTTRGVLSQFAAERLGVTTARFVGDIAFSGKAFEKRIFPINEPIQTIIVSDPHRPNIYKRSFVDLLYGLQHLFPEAELRVALHGNNETIWGTSRQHGFECVPIYEDAKNGLNIYDSADLHVGFRVHGHVSALKRRKYSYLLEQDGRDRLRAHLAHQDLSSKYSDSLISCEATNVNPMVVAWRCPSNQ